MSEQWERGEHPAQAEVHEPIESEFEIDEYGDEPAQETLPESGEESGHAVPGEDQE